MTNILFCLYISINKFLAYLTNRFQLLNGRILVLQTVLNEADVTHFMVVSHNLSWAGVAQSV
jgi:hypothetical protein